MSRVALVTGGSRGIGRAIVRALHRDGFAVIIHYRGSEKGARELAEDLGSRAHLVKGDLARPGEPARVWTDALAWTGTIDVLVNNAGAWLDSPVEDLLAWDQGWEANLALNLLAPAALCRLAINHFRATARPGAIINLASRSSHRGDDADHLAYGAAKGGLLALTKGIARSFAPDRILAYAVAPGWVATDLAGPEIATRTASLPLGEVTPPEDVAEVVAFLASGRSPHTTGATIDITG